MYKNIVNNTNSSIEFINMVFDNDLIIEIE